MATKKDLLSVIPSAAAEERLTTMDFAGGSADATGGQERRSTNLDFSEVTDEVTPGPEGATRDPSSTVDEIDQAFVADEIDSAFSGRGKGSAIEVDPSAPDLGGSGNLKEIYYRALAKMGDTPEEQKQSLAGRFGEKNVKVKDGKVLFKREGDKKFREFDKDEFSFVTDVLADFAGDAIEAAGSTAAGLATGIGVGAATGNPVLGYGAGVAAESAAGTSIRRGLKSFADIEDEDSFAADFSTDLALNTLFAGGANLMGGAIRLLKSIKNGGPMTRIRKVMVLQAAIDNVLSGAGISRPTANEVGKELAGRALIIDSRKQEGALFKQSKQLAEGVSVVIDDALAKSGGQRISMKPQLDELRNKLRGAGLQVDDRGFLTGTKVEPASFDVVTGATPEKTISTFSPNPKQGEAFVNKETLTKAPFGDPNPANIKELAENFNLLVEAERSGGLDIKSLHKNVQKLQKLSEFKPKDGAISDETLGFYREAQAILGNLRQEALSKIYPKDANGASAVDVFQEAHQRIGLLNQFIKEFNNSESASAFTAQLIRPKAPERVEALRKLFGDGSKEMKLVRDFWIQNLIDKNTKNGVLDSGAFSKELKEYGPDVVNQLLDEKTHSKIKLYAKALEAIPKADLLKSDDAGSSGLLLNAIKAIFLPTWGQKNAQVNLAYKMFKENASLAERLTDDHMLKWAREAATNEEAMGILKTRSILDKLWRASIKKRLPNGRTIYIETPYVRNILRTQVTEQEDFRAPVQSMINDMGMQMDQNQGEMSNAL